MIWPCGKRLPEKHIEITLAGRLLCVAASLVWIILAAALMVMPAPISAAEKTLHLGIPSHGWPPYIIVQDDQQSGIALDVVQMIGARAGIRVIIRYYPEKRAHRMVEQGVIDAWFDAKEWTVNPQRYLWTDPVVESKDRLIYRQALPVVFNRIVDLFGKTIGTHLGYIYPRLETYFQKGLIVRSDARGEPAMLKMLALGRTDAAIINQLVALWVIKNDPYLHLADFAFSNQVVDRAGYRIMFTRGNDWSAFINFFNTELADMRHDGRLDRIISQYR